MSKKMLTQYALWEQDLSQGIDEAVETNSEIQETDQIFEEQIVFLRKELQEIGRKDLDPILLEISDHYRDLKVLILEMVAIALDEKTLAFRLVKKFKQKGWLDEETYRKLKTAITIMPSHNQEKDQLLK